MAQDISGFGLTVTLIATGSIPAGFQITQFADDADPFDAPSVALAETAMGLNGDLVSWNTPNPLPITLNVIPGTDDDIALRILAERNRVGRGKTSSRDDITLVVQYPDESLVTYTEGKLISAPTSRSVASSGRQKSNAFVFNFENKIGA